MRKNHVLDEKGKTCSIISKLHQKHWLSNSNLFHQIIEWRKIELEVARRDMIWWRRALMRGVGWGGQRTRGAVHTLFQNTSSEAVYQNTSAPKCHSERAVATTTVQQRQYEKCSSVAVATPAHAPWRSGCLLTANHYSHYRETPQH